MFELSISSICSDHGLAPIRRQAIILTNDGWLDYRRIYASLGLNVLANFSGIWIKIETFSFKKMLVNLSSAKWWSICTGLNVLKTSLEMIWIHLQRRRRRIDRSMIGYPTDFKHTGHIGAGDMMTNGSHVGVSCCVLGEVISIFKV